MWVRLYTHMHMWTHTGTLKIVPWGRYLACRDNVLPTSSGLLKVLGLGTEYFLMRRWSQKSLRSPQTLRLLPFLLIIHQNLLIRSCWRWHTSLLQGLVKSRRVSEPWKVLCRLPREKRHPFKQSWALQASHLLNLDVCPLFYLSSLMYLPSGIFLQMVPN